MKVMRKFEKEVKKFKIGDQITLGRYTATAMAQDETGTTFCLDQVYGEKPMRYGDEKRIKALYNSKMFDEVRDLMVSFRPEWDDEIEAPFRMLRSPTAEEIWGKRVASGILPAAVDGADKRWEAMKDTRNRIGFDVKGCIRNYWTESFTGNDEINGHVILCFDGDAAAIDMECGDNYVFFRPVFKLKG